MVFGEPKMAERCQALGILFFLCLLCLVPARSASAGAEGEFLPQLSRPQLIFRNKILKIVEQVREEHHLDVKFEDLDRERFQRESLVFREAEPQDYGRMYRFLSLLHDELQKYPPGFLRPRQLQVIYLVKGLFNDDKNAQGIYDYRNKIIFFDFARQFGGELAQRHNIHHEFFHVIDTNSFYWQGKEDWEDLNPPGFQYAGKGKVHIDPERNESNYFAPNKKGFVTYYAMMSPFEDKAEVFACLFVRSQNKLIHRWAEKDRILRRKIAFIQEFLTAYTDGVVNEEYFSRLWGDSAP